MSDPGMAAGAATRAGAPLPPATTCPKPTKSEASTSKKPKTRLKKALDDLKQTLTKDQRTDFEKCNLKDVEAAIKSIQDTLGARRRLPNLERLSKFVSMVGQLAISTGDFASVNGESGFLWAPIRHALVQVTQHGPRTGKSDYLDNLVVILAEIGDIFPHLSEYQDLFAQYPDVLDIMVDYTEIILQFYAGLMEVFNKSAWWSMFDSSWSRFKRLAEDTKLALRRNRKLLREAKETASMREIQAIREHLEQQDGTTTLKDAEASKERRRFQRQEVAVKLAPPNYSDDQCDLQDRMHESARGDWLLGDRRFIGWADVEDEEHKTLNLNGCPGAGKTFLVSSVIRYLQDIRAQSTKPIWLAYFFFKHDENDKTAFTSVLRALIDQLVTEDGDETLLDHAFRQLSTVYRPPRDLLTKLASTAVQAKRFCFLVIDGLDECEPQNQISLLLQWLKEVIRTPGDSPFTVRILFSARREWYLEKEILSFPSVASVRVDAFEAHKLAIRQYVQHEAKAILKRSPCSDTEKSIVDNIMSKAGGMFLFARVVLAYLRDMPTRQELVDALQENEFPSGLEEAYERVAKRVFGAKPVRSTSAKPRLTGQDLARRMLSWVSCASRPLHWREIQARFMINPDVGPQTNAERCKAEFSPKRMCGCFVDVTGTGEESEKLVHIVHRTAAEYLENTERIPSSMEQHLDMLTFCSRYLKSAPFTESPTLQVRKEHAETGYYAFQEYAAAHWWDHAHALESLPPPGHNHETFQAAAVELADLLAHYDKTCELSRASLIMADQSPDANLRNILAKLDTSPSERSRHFLFEDRISLAREAVDALYSRTSGQESQSSSTRIETMYGPLRFKCPKPWCAQFHSGFDADARLQEHMSAHERPFRCPHVDCPAFTLGFQSQDALDRHDKGSHRVENVALFPTIADLDTSAYALLCRAIREGSLERVKQLLSSINVKEVFEARPSGSMLKGLTPLIVAIRCGNLQICKCFLDAGAPVNYKPRDPHITPLREAIAAENIEIFQLLLGQDGVDYLENLDESGKMKPVSKLLFVDRDTSYDTLGLALAIASEHFVIPLLSKGNLPPKRHWRYFLAVCASRAPNRGQIFHLLRKHLPNASLDWTSDQGRPLFSYAAEADNVEVMGILLAAGFGNINRRSKFGRSPLSYAAQGGSAAAIRTILGLEGVELDTNDDKKRTAYWYAAERGHLHVLKLLWAAQCPGIDQPDLDGMTALFAAVDSGGVDCVRWLLAIGSVQADRADKDGRTPLSAAFVRYSEKNISLKRLEIARMLINAAPVIADMADRCGWSPLHLTATEDHFGATFASELLDSFDTIDVNRKSTDKKAMFSTYIYANTTALEVASMYQGNRQVARAIMATGRFDFSAINEKRTSELLREGLQNRGTAIVIEMFQHGFRPRLAEVLHKDVALASHLLVAMDQTLTIEGLKHPECLEIFELLRTPADQEVDRKELLGARHPHLLRVVRTALGADGAWQPGDPPFPTLTER
ncbi:hypothetical protein MAPG_10476 [Magnaporthiopsis poae ATCC 64411]|uniref:NACHT domain-containing protein n=1 Tax=Magnaporthiopsis poae (strain ATCC 64411 / 73-15) TaxID=644358 RepID=A0A0C4ECP4_MAGP6|nr:hypothetical protein MAPG_10476 [Magnaporthiopsis poae ATCC 64411]